MVSKLKLAAVFAVGATIGGFIGTKIVDNKYSKIAQDEIDSVKRAFRNRKKKEVNQDNASDLNKKAYEDELVKNGYSEPRHEEKEESVTSDRPYVVTPDEFGEKEDYDIISLTYYADKVLTDENDEPINDVEGLIGVESLSHFGEFEDDSVYVRDDRLKCEYEILLDMRKYSEVLAGKRNVKK